MEENGKFSQLEMSTFQLKPRQTTNSQKTLHVSIMRQTGVFMTMVPFCWHNFRGDGYSNDESMTGFYCDIALRNSALSVSYILSNCEWFKFENKVVLLYGDKLLGVDSIINGTISRDWYYYIIVKAVYVVCEMMNAEKNFTSSY